MKSRLRVLSAWLQPERFSSTLTWVIGVGLILLVTFADIYTGNDISLSLFYFIPVLYVSWYAGWGSAILTALLAAASWIVTEGILKPEIPPLIAAWNAFGRLVIFLAAALMLHHIRVLLLKQVEQERDKYVRVVDTIVEGLAVVDTQGTIKAVNARVADLFGTSPEQLVGRNILSFVRDEADAGSLSSMLSRSQVSEEPLEIRFVTAGNRDIWALVSGTAAPNSKEVLILILDITERKQAEKELRRLYEETSAVRRLGSVFAESLLLEKRLQGAVDTVLELLHFDAGAIYLVEDGSENLTLKYVRGLSAEFASTYRQWPMSKGVTGFAARTRQPQYREDVVSDPVFDQSIREMENIRGFASVPLLSKEKVLGVLNLMLRTPHVFSDQERSLLETFSLAIGMAIENAQLYEAAKRREAQVRRLSLDLTRVQEDERRRFARELHDGLSQTLTMLKLHAELAAKRAEKDSSVESKSLQEVIALAEEAQAEAKRIAHDLRPSVLDDFGLGAAITMIATNFERRTGIAMELHIAEGIGRMDLVVEAALYRIVQELLTNVAKHAHASRVTLELKVTDGTITLSLSDDGSGFDPAGIQFGGIGPHRSGLRNVRERVELLGGRLALDSRPGEGARFILAVPLRHPTSGTDRKELQQFP